MKYNNEQKEGHTMKNTKLKRTIIFFAIMLGIAIMPLSKTSALSASLDCSPKIVNPGDELTCIMTADSTGSSEVQNISSVEAEVAVSGNITLKNVGFYQWWEKFSDPSGGIGKFTIAYANDARSIHREGSDIKLAKLTITAGPSVGSGTVSVKNIIYTSKEYTSNKNPLTSNTETISIVAPKKPDEYVKPGSGEIEQKTETKETKTKETETKTSTGGSPSTARPVTPTTAPTSKDPKMSSNTYLSSLSLSDGKIKFDKDTTEYSLSVPYSTTDMEVLTVVDDEKSTITVSGNTDLVVGENTITVLVTSENGATRTYTITVMREAEGAPVKKTDDPEIKEETSLVAVFGVIFLSLLGLGVIAFFIFFIIKRKKDKKDKIPVDPYDEMPAQEIQKEIPKPDYTNVPNTKARYNDSTTNTVAPVDFGFKPQNNPPEDNTAKENTENEDLSEETPPQDSYYQ